MQQTATTASQSPNQYLRQARGSYAKFICLNCRARKIKCVLPETAALEPSDSPQPPDSSCTRCRQQGLECVVDRTVLGRPAIKRRRPDEKARGSVDEGCDAEDADPESVQAFLLSDVGDAVDGIEQSPLGLSARVKPNKQEIFSALVDSTKLFSGLMAKDARFGELSIGTKGEVGTVLGVVSEELAVKLDASLVWHRLYFPYLPFIATLRQELVETGEYESVRLHTEALLALMCLIAVEVPSTQIREVEKLWQQLQNLVCTYGHEVLFTLPIHPHTLYFFDLCNSYKPLVFVSRQGAAAAAIRGNLTTTLAKRTAQKLEMDKAAERLEALTLQPLRSETKLVESLVSEALQWCRWVILEHLVDGYVVRPIQEQRRPLPEIHWILGVTRKAVERYQISPGLVMFFHSICSMEVDMQSAVAAKQNWLRVHTLDALIATHRESCSEQGRYLAMLLANCNIIGIPQATEQIQAIPQLRAMDLNISRVRICGLSLSYGLISGLHPPAASDSRPHDVTPDDAVQIRDQVISNLRKWRQTDQPGSIANFLASHADARTKCQAQALRSFITSADNLRVNGVPLIPPATETVSVLLYCCRDMVENNATLLKGWGVMNPDVDVQLLLFQDVAKRLDGMDFLGGGPEALARGSIYAAGAKMVKSLCSIIAGWRKAVAEKEVRAAAEKGAQFFKPEYQQSRGLDRFLEGQALYDDWSKWPQAENLDFSELFADGADWVSWANDVVPNEGDQG